MNTPTIERLTKVLIGKKEERIINSATHEGSLQLPYIGRAGKYTERYAMTPDALGIERMKALKVVPQVKMVENITRAAMIYAASAAAPLGHAYPESVRRIYGLKAVESSKYSGPKADPKDKADMRNSINALWSNRFDRRIPENNVKQTLELADQLINAALDELEEINGLGGYKKVDALILANQYKAAFCNQIEFDSQSRVPNEQMFVNQFTFNKNLQTAFLIHKYGTADPHLYLRDILTKNVATFESIAKTANIDTSRMLNMIELTEDNAETQRITSSDLKSAALNAKKSVRGAFNAYIKPDQYTESMPNVLLNFTVFTDGEPMKESFYFTPKTTTNLVGDHDEWVEFAKYGQIPELISNVNELMETEERNKRYRLELQEKLKEENAQKLAEAKELYRGSKQITSVAQLEGTYFDQKGISEEAFTFLKDKARITPNGELIVQLDDALTSSSSIDQARGFQKLLSEKVTIVDEFGGTELTNKLFVGLGSGEKKNCFVTLGDPKKASCIGVAEGLANGIHSIEQLTNRGYDVAIICALDAGNISHAIRNIITKHPTKPIFNFADNDLFSKDGFERPLDAVKASIVETRKVVTLENVGLKIATNFKTAIDLPFIHIDFSNVHGENFIAQQRENKLSDIDDLISLYQKQLMKSGTPKTEASQLAKAKAGDFVTELFEQAMRTSVTPHWNQDTQHEFRWIPSDRNLNSDTLQNYHDVKSAIHKAENYFDSVVNQSIEYGTYAEVIKHGRKRNFSFSDSVVAEPTQLPEIKEQLRQIDVQPELIQVSEETIPAQIYESIEDLEAQLASLERRKDNLENAVSDKAAERYIQIEEQIQKLQSELEILHEQKENYGGKALSPEQILAADISMLKDWAVSIANELQTLSPVKDKERQTLINDAAFDLTCILADLNGREISVYAQNLSKRMDSMPSLAEAKGVVDKALGTELTNFGSKNLTERLRSAEAQQEVSNVLGIIGRTIKDALAPDTTLRETELNAASDTPLAEEPHAAPESAEPEPAEPEAPAEVVAEEQYVAPESTESEPAEPESPAEVAAEEQHAASEAALSEPVEPEAPAEVVAEQQYAAPESTESEPAEPESPAEVAAEEQHAAPESAEPEPAEPEAPAEVAEEQHAAPEAALSEPAEPESPAEVAAEEQHAAPESAEPEPAEPEAPAEVAEEQHAAPEAALSEPAEPESPAEVAEEQHAAPEAALSEPAEPESP
ncbi:hypothetical protein, partial [Vibrio fluvialis]|uniref:hypothetical protein n=1 Tax=Vibrio fluvialis TaxID=676 RepID=UPI0023A94411